MENQPAKVLTHQSSAISKQFNVVEMKNQLARVLTQVPFAVPVFYLSRNEVL